MCIFVPKLAPISRSIWFKEEKIRFSAFQRHKTWDPALKSPEYQFKVPFMMYADFELILEPIQGASNNPNVSSARGVNIHMPSGWCIYSKFAYENVTNPLAYLLLANFLLTS